MKNITPMYYLHLLLLLILRPLAWTTLSSLLQYRLTKKVRLYLKSWRKWSLRNKNLTKKDNRIWKNNRKRTVVKLIWLGKMAL